MKASEIRETYLSFFAERGHKIVPSASLVPSVHDPSVLLTTAGMQPFKPYFRGEEEPPSKRLTPASSAASVLASAKSRVLWRCMFQVTSGYLPTKYETVS